jgi:hypothetical protein
MIFEQFPNIYIINLASRTDRKSEMIRELRRVGLGPDRYTFFSACTASEAGVFRTKGAAGAYQKPLSYSRIGGAERR